MTGKEIFEIIVGLSSIGSLIVALMVKSEVTKMKFELQQKVSTGSQKIRGDGNNQAGGNIG